MTRLEDRAKSGIIVLWLVAVLVFKAAPYVTGLLTQQETLNTTGVVAGVNVGVYQDNAGTQNLTAINWGICYPGETKTVVAYVKNLGTVDATLTILTADWTPPLVASYLTLTTDYAGQPLQPNETRLLTLTLAIAPDTEPFETFDFNIEIVSEG